MDNTEDPTTSTDNKTSDTTQRLNPTNEATFRALKSISSKQVQCTHHIELLENHLMNGTSPKGLSSNLQPNVPYADTTLLIQWEKVKLEFQSKLILTLSQYWRRYKEKLEEDHSRLSQQLKANTVHEEWTKMQEILQKVTDAAVMRYTRRGERNTEEIENSSNAKDGGNRRGGSKTSRTRKQRDA